MVVQETVIIEYRELLKGEKARELEERLKKMHLQIVNTGKYGLRFYSKLSKQFVNTGDALKKAEKQGYKFDARLLSIMFGAMQLSRFFSKMLAPIEDAAGLQEYWGAILMENTADAIDPAIAALDATGEAMAIMNAATGGNLGTMLLFGQATAGTLSFLSQFGLFTGALADKLKELGLGFITENLQKIASTAWKATVEWIQSGWDVIKENLGKVADKIYSTTINFISNISNVASQFSSWYNSLPTAHKILVVIGIATTAFMVAKLIGEWLGRVIGKYAAAGLMTGISIGLGIISVALALTGIGAPFAIALGAAAVGIAAAGVSLAASAAGESTPFRYGGIVTRPTTALIGERGPEAVIPLDRAGMGVTIQSPTINISSIVGRESTEMIVREIIDKLGLGLTRVG